jgi:hypothetical protein
MVAEKYTQVLQQASKEPWFVAAALILDPFDDLSLEQRKAAAIPAIGLSANMLTRYLSVLARIREISSRHSIPVDRLLTSVFSATEIAVRIYDRDPASGLSALEKLKDRRTTLVKLKGELRENEKRRQRERASKGKSIEEREVALRRFVETKLGAASALVRRPALRPFSKVGWLVLDGGGRPYCGIDLFDSEGQVLEAKLAQAIPLSSFFKQFYILFHGELEEDFLSRLNATLDFFGAGTFGALYMNANGSIEALRSATGNSSAHRGSDYRALEALFAYGRGPRVGNPGDASTA